MNGKLILKKLLLQLLHIFILTVVMFAVGNFIPNAIYMIVIGTAIITGIVYARRTKHGEPEEEYHKATDSDALGDDIRYLLTGFSEFRAELISAAIITLIFLIIDTFSSFAAVVNGGIQPGSVITYIIIYAIFFVIDAAVWLILFHQYHETRVRNR